MSGPSAKSRPRRRAPPSLVGRLIWLAAGWSVALLLLTGVALSVNFDRAAIGRFDRDLADDATTLLAGSTVGPDGQVSAPPLTDARALLAYSGKYWQLSEFGPDGRAHAIANALSRSLFDTELTSPPDLKARLEAAQGKRVAYNAPGPLRQRLRVVALASHLPGRAAPVIFLTAEDRTPVDRDVRRFAVTTAIALTLLGAGLVAAVILQVKVGLRPLFAMRRDVAHVREGGASRLSGDYAPELAPLAKELNALLDHNQQVVERQRTHVGNLAHALKTPISVMLSEAEAQPGSLAEVVARQASSMREHVEHHLRRARAAARAPGGAERTEVEPVLDELARTLDRIYGRRGVDIDWSVEGEGPDASAPSSLGALAFHGERQDLLEMIGNLLENACKYTRTLAVARARAEAGQLLIVIDDDGPGLQPTEREEALQRGRRLDESAPGSGLGLAIVDELARAYGGSLSLGDAPEGGLRATLRLPKAAAQG